jgi:hypothetical protein
MQDRCVRAYILDAQDLHNLQHHAHYLGHTRSYLQEVFYTRGCLAFMYLARNPFLYVPYIFPILPRPDPL